mmetsp:Transcript_43187/g.123081  ORF Transcript_43187/g.123081 Transcript_43187/m.123081 type:complete len:442 (+) Transcript_43187:98-1423(+)
MAQRVHKHQGSCSSLSTSAEARADSPESFSSRSSSAEEQREDQRPIPKGLKSPKEALGKAADGPLDPNLWYIHGNRYDLQAFVDKHPGGRLAILSGRGRDCTALFESYHVWNDRHRKVLKAYGPAPPPPDPFYEDLKKHVRAAFPGGREDTKMGWDARIGLLLLWSVMVLLFFVVRTPLACAGAGVLLGTIGTRMAHEGGHYQVSHKEWVNRLYLFLGYFLAGPSMGWHYRHVISHHAHTNQELDVDVLYIWIADVLPTWVKMLILPVLPIGSVFEVGPKSAVDLVLLRSIGGNPVDVRIGGLLPEVLLWAVFHWTIGPSWLCYLCMWWTAGAVFLPCSQVAHAILFPKAKDTSSWAQMQIAESCDFAADSDFWFHVAFGLTTQVEHHLFPGIAHRCYGKVRQIVRKVCKDHGVHHNDVTAGQAFGALWRRWAWGEVLALC